MAARKRAKSGVNSHQFSPAQLEDLRWGRAKADWLDPLKPGIDDILDEKIVVPF